MGRFGSLHFSAVFAWAAVVDGVLVAFLDAVSTGNAAAVVDGAVLMVYAGSLAVACAESALDALVLVDVHLQE